MKYIIKYLSKNIIVSYDICYMWWSTQQSVHSTMNEVSGGKQDISNTSTWETLSGQPASSLSTMHHHHPTLQQDTTPTVAQVIVPTPVKLQTPILSSTQSIPDHCSQLGHIQQSGLMTQVLMHIKVYINLLVNIYFLFNMDNISFSIY